MIFDVKILFFYRLAVSIQAVKNIPFKDLDVDDLLFDSSLYLLKEHITTQKQSKELEKFQQKYNEILEYCQKKSIGKQNYYKKIEKLNLIKVPDMSKIEKPDISKELKEYGFNLENIGEIFSKLK